MGFFVYRLTPNALRWGAPCALRYFEVLMPAIASLEDLKVTQRDFRSMSLAATPNDLPACSKHLDLRSLGVGGWRRWAPYALRLTMKKGEGG